MPYINGTGWDLLHGKPVGALLEAFPMRCRKTLPQRPHQSAVVLKASAEGSITQNKDNFRQILQVLTRKSFPQRSCLQHVGGNTCVALQKAKHFTLRHPEGQLHGRRGRRCVLEDGMLRARASFACISIVRHTTVAFYHRARREA